MEELQYGYLDRNYNYIIYLYKLVSFNVYIIQLLDPKEVNAHEREFVLVLSISFFCLLSLPERNFFKIMFQITWYDLRYFIERILERYSLDFFSNGCQVVINCVFSCDRKGTRNSRFSPAGGCAVNFHRFWRCILQKCEEPSIVLTELGKHDVVEGNTFFFFAIITI